MSIADVVQTGSPFRLRLNDAWLPLEGVTPGVQTATARPSSELVTVDGRRFVQRAPRGPREWTLDFTYAPAAAVTALRVACEVDEVWLSDSASASANLFDPRDTHGTDLEAAVIDCGGVPLRVLPDEHVATVAVRGGVQLRLGYYTSSGAGVEVGSAVFPGGSVDLDASAGSAPPRRDVTFTPASDGDLVLTLSTATVTGLQLTEGALPSAWVPGERMPCKVSVVDPERTMTMLHGGAWRSDFSVTVREVG